VLLPLLLTLSTAALAGDLEISGRGLIRVKVDGQPARRRVGERKAWVVGLADGDHRVEVYGLIGSKLLASHTVTLLGEERVLVHYEAGEVTEIGRGRSLAVERAAWAMAEAAARSAEAEAMAAEAEAAAAAARARAAEAHADAAKAAEAALEVQSLLSQPGIGSTTEGATLDSMNPAPDPPPGFTGLSAGTGGTAQASASFSGLDPNLWAVSLDGAPVGWSDSLGAFVAPDLLPGTVPFVVSFQGQTALEGDFTTEPGQHTACTLLARPDGYDYGCVNGGAPLTSADLAAPTTGGPMEASLGKPTMSETLFELLVDSLYGTPYAKNKLQALEAASHRHRFTCAQVVRVLDAFMYNSDKVEAVRELRPAILDPGNFFVIEAALPYKTDKDAVRAMFADHLAPGPDGPDGAPADAGAQGGDAPDGGTAAPEPQPQPMPNPGTAPPTE